MGDAGRNGNAGLEQGVPQRIPSPPAARGTVGALRMPGVPAGTFITSSFRASSSPRGGSVLCFCTVLPLDAVSIPCSSSPERPAAHGQTEFTAPRLFRLWAAVSLFLTCARITTYVQPLGIPAYIRSLFFK